MFREFTFLIGWLAWAVFWFNASSARAQNAAIQDDAEPINFAQAPEFWDIVERVVKAPDLELYWTSWRTQRRWISTLRRYRP